MIALRNALSNLSALLVASTVGCTIVTSQPGANCNPTGSGGSAAGTGLGGASASGGSMNPNGGDAGAGDPTPTGKWVNVTSNLANMPSSCGALGLVSAKPDEDLLIAGVAEHGLWSSSDGGETWEQFGDSIGVTNHVSAIIYDPDHPKRFWESGTYGNGFYLTSDDGAHFVQQGDIQHIDFVSIDFTDPKRQLMLAGGHEQEQKLYRSTDGGQTWPEIGQALPAKTFCTEPLIVDAKTYLVGCAYYGSSTGILRTTNGGGTWSSVSAKGGIAAPFVATDGTIYWVADFNGGFVKSTDSGETWTLPAHEGELKPVRFIELPDERIAAVGQNALVVSSDHGTTWHEVTTALPFTPMSLTYSAQQKAFFISHFDCGAPPVPVAPDAIMRYDFE